MPSAPHLKQLYQDYGTYNILYNQLNLPSPSVEYSWYRTKHLLQDEASRIIREKLKEKKEITVCDLGCGNGALLIRLAQEFKNQPVKFTGLELSSPFVDYGKKAALIKDLSAVSFYLFDVESEKFKTTYDLIIQSEVLEHMIRPDQTLRRIYAALNPQGVFLLSTPNIKNWVKYPFFFLKSLVAKNNQKDLRKQLTKSEEKYKLAEQEQHLHVYSFSELSNALKKIGFSIYSTPRSTTLFGGPFLDKHLVIFSILIFFDFILNFLPFPQIGWDLIFFAKKN